MGPNMDYMPFSCAFGKTGSARFCPLSVSEFSA